jgi:DNA-binding transcriptional LysR family regulator
MWDREQPHPRRATIAIAGIVEKFYFSIGRYLFDYRRSIMQWIDRIGRRLKLRDLHVLMAVAEARSMAKAARQLAVSQPVVSKTISDLEHALGVKLLDRTPGGVEPNLYGRALLKRGVSIFDELRQSVNEIEFLADPRVGEVRIACPEPILAGLLPVIVKRLQRRHRRLTFDVVQAHTAAQQLRELRERNVDLIMGRIVVPMSEEDLAIETLFDDPMVVVAGLHNPWLRRRRIELADLVSEPWVLPRYQLMIGALMLEIFRACGLKEPRPEIVSDSLQLTAMLLASGRYLSMFPASLLRFGAHLPFKALPIKLPNPTRPVGIVTLKGRTNSPVANLVIDCARDIAKPIARNRRRMP